jgi:Dual specificity phosphatase, catalytic domain/Gelsolin repeat
MDSTCETEAETDAASTSGESITPRKMLWRSASWSAFSSPILSPTQNQQPRFKPKLKPDLVRPPRRPGRLALPLRPSLAGWPRQASDDSTSTPAGSLDDPHTADLSRVTDHVYLGSDSAARDRAALRRHGITHILNCVGSACPDYFRGDNELVYKTLWLHDSPGEDLASILYDAFDFLESVVVALPPNGGRVLVHCVRGASRSAAVVVAYLMWHHALPFDAALRKVRAARPVADPNLGFAAQLLRHQHRTLGLPASPGSIHRVLRVAPHSPYAPLDLVPKSVLPAGDPRSYLDSRGAFLIHVPDAIYIWIGAKCEQAMAVVASKVARQVGRYERVLAPVVTVNEGSESDEFWAAVSDDLVILDPSEVGKRRVDNYDLDFEIFQHALKLNSSEEPLESNTPSSSSSSADSTFSPASSSSSDWYYSPSTPDRLAFCQTPRVALITVKEQKSDWIFPSSTKIGISKSKAGSLAERRGGIAPSLNFSEQAEAEHEQIMMDWCPSPTFIPDLDEEHRVDFKKQFSLDHSDESDKAEAEEPAGGEQKKLNLIQPALYRWPELDQIEDIHRDVLDSKSIFLMVTPDSRIGARKLQGRVLYLWLGANAKLVDKDKQKLEFWARSIGNKFVDQMGLPGNTSFEVLV